MVFCLFCLFVLFCPPPLVNRRGLNKNCVNRGKVEQGEVSACAACLRWMCAPLEPESGSLASFSNPTQAIQSHYQIGNYNPYPSIDVDHLVFCLLSCPQSGVISPGLAAVISMAPLPVRDLSNPFREGGNDATALAGCSSFSAEDGNVEYFEDMSRASETNMSR